MSGQQLSHALPDPPGAGRRRSTKARRLAALAGCLLTAALALPVPPAGATPTTMVDLGAASSYAVLSGASVGNTVSAPGGPHTTLRGNLGVKANTQPTGFPPGLVTGETNVGNAAAAKAHADLVAAYSEVAARTGGDVLPGALAGTTIAPGLYAIAGAVSNTGTVTLDGENNPNAVFVFKVNGALAMAAGSHVVLINGARASRVFWQVNGAGAVGANADFAGTLMALDAVAVGAGSMVNGRAFARNGALTLDANEFYSAPPVVTIAGGTSAITTDTTPTISGTTDVAAPAIVTVTINGQTLFATPAAGGSWSVTSAILANGTYPVVSSVSDGAGNPGVATQQLTIDTVLPVVTLDGGPFSSTNDPTPTISGTTDVGVGAIVLVAIGSQTLSALVQVGGTWNITPAALTDGMRSVIASVADLAGNAGTASQSLTVDTAPPAATISGGTNALTNDATPAIWGSAAVAPGTSVTLTLADVTLLAVVQSDGTWSVIASALSEGPHRLIMSVSDAAGNPATFTQWLTVDTVAPTVAITGGAIATTSDVAPTIAGTSDAAPGTTVTVTIAGKTMTTLVQANGSWNATPAVLAEGTWAVVASAPDAAGNLGSAGQLLTIAVDVLSDGPAPVGDAARAGAARDTVAPTVVVPPLGTPPAGGGLALNAAGETTVTRAATQSVKGTSLSLGTKVTAPAGGPVVATAAGTVRIKGVKRPIMLASVSSPIAAGRSTTLKLRASGSRSTARAALARVRAAIRTGTKVTATITVTIVDARGNRRVVRRAVELTG